MKRAIVDTNVPIVANGRPDRANGGRLPSAKCKLAAIDFLIKLLNSGHLLLDQAGEIQAEYRRYLNPSGQPDVGDRFFLEVYRRGPPWVQRIELPKASDGSYENFPVDAALASFDRSDRKFVALARRGKAPVVVATDRGWVRHHAALSRNRVSVEFLCGCDRAEWFET